jgi:hypothetical protein
MISAVHLLLESAGLGRVLIFHSCSVKDEGGDEGGLISNLLLLNLLMTNGISRCMIPL